MHSPITISDLRNNSCNAIFFKNAGFHGDTKYVVNEARMELTVHMEVDGMKRKTTYSFDHQGTIKGVVGRG